MPPGKAPRAPDAGRQPRQGAAGPDAAGPADVLVEDEPAVREGLVVLLKAWGASVLAFDSVAALQAWLARQRPAEAPDLLLVDYRLPQGQTGLDALAALRAPLAGARAAGHRHHRQHHRRPRERGRRTRLPPADQAGAAEQAARDDRLQAGRAPADLPQLTGTGGGHALQLPGRGRDTGVERRTPHVQPPA